MQKVNEDLIHRRAMVEGDHPFVYNSMLRTLKNAGATEKLVDDDIFFDEYRKILSKILDRCQGFCAVAADDHDQIFGYVLYSQSHSQPALHYIYVKQTFRGMGIAQHLIAAVRQESNHKGPLIVTHSTDPFRRWLEPRGLYIFNPYKLGEMLWK